MINITVHARTKNQRPMPFKGQEVYFSVHEPVTTINRHPPLPTNFVQPKLVPIGGGSGFTFVRLFAVCKGSITIIDPLLFV